VKIEIVVPDKRATRVVDTIARSTRTGSIGDGKIIVADSITLEKIRICGMGRERCGVM
jgi:nitrogen regulatory protein PII